MDGGRCDHARTGMRQHLRLRINPRPGRARRSIVGGIRFHSPLCCRAHRVAKGSDLIAAEILSAYFDYCARSGLGSFHVETRSDWSFRTSCLSCFEALGIHTSNGMVSAKEAIRTSRSSNESTYPPVYRPGTGSDFWQRGASDNSPGSSMPLQRLRSELPTGLRISPGV